MHLVRLLYIVALISLWLTACGTKGPLYFPQKEPPPAPQPSEETQKNQ
ncbi:LPS translocon maturation chaperone LptM [Nitrosomonas sp. Is37]|nr:lipoprotein [Nitrosomonas sp. Is37]MDV6343469.1 lipoprotein [Nitrosomonas sp. Is37]